MATAKVRDILKMSHRDGWWLERQVGSHRQYRHSAKPGTVTVPGQMSDTLGHGMVGSMLR